MPERRSLRHRISTWFSAAALTLSALACCAIGASAEAQIAAPSVEFSLPKTVSAKEAAETPLVIELKSDGKLPETSWLEIVTVPPSITLSAGTLEDGIWRVPLAVVPGLTLRVPADVYGEGFIYVTLIDNGTLMTAATSTLSIAQRPPAPPEPAATAAAAPAADRPTAVGSISAPVEPQIAPASSAPPTPSNDVAVAPLVQPVETSVAPAPPIPAIPAPAPVPAAPVATAAAERAMAPPPPPPPAPPAPSAPPAIVAVVTPPAAPPAVAAPPSPAPAAAAVIVTSSAPAPQTPQPAPDKPQPPRTEPSATTARQQRLIAQGDSNLSDGNIANARQYFAAAAELGSALAAFRLAETNDPHELEKAKVVGLKIDAAEAARWYRKAAELGMAEAAERLQRLQTR